MAKVKIFDKFGCQIEEHEIDVSLTQWLKGLSNYHETARPPYSAKLNGQFWPYDKHDDDLAPDDELELTVEPQGASLPFIIISLASAAYSFYVATNLPKTYQNTAERGKSIYNANARANDVRPSDIIREVAGQINIFPDLICPPHRKFVDHDEFLYLMLSVTRGYIFMEASNVYIAETPIGNYGGDVSISIFEPGDTVTGNIAHENWYQTKEVSDLKLTTATDEINGNWSIGIPASNQITSYLDGVAETFPFAVDAVFEITSGSNQGKWRVDSLSGGSNETATVVPQQIDTTAGISVNFALSQTSSTRNESVYRNTNFIDSVASPYPTLTDVSPQEAITWRALNGGVNWEGPFEVIPENETTQYLEIDLTFPNGLFSLDNSGDPQSKSVEVVLQWREIGASAWNTILDTSQSPTTTQYTDNSYDARGYTIEVDLGSAVRPELRFRRETQDSVLATISDEVFVSRVKAKLETPTSYADVTTIAMSLRGTNALARTSENKINIKGATRKLPTLAEVQSAATGTPFDLTASTTQSTGNEWDVSTAVFDHEADLEQLAGAMSGFDIDSTGTKVIMSQGAPYRSFTLSTAFDLRTATRNGGGSLKNTTATSSSSTRWGDSGNKIYFLRQSTGVVYQWDLTTAYDADTASDSSNSLATGAQTTTPTDISFSADGAKCYVADQDGTIYQYGLSTPWDLSTGSYDSLSFDTSTQLLLNSPKDDLEGCYVGNSGTRLYILTDASNVYSYTLSTAYDISTATYDSKTFSASTADPNYGTLWVNADYMFVTETDNDNARVFLLSSTTDNRSTQSICRFVANALYDALGNDVNDVVDWTTLDTLDTLLEGRSDYLNMDFSDETDLWEAVRIMFSPGYTEPAVKEGKLTPIRIATGSDYTQLYTPDMMLEGGLVIDDNFWDGQDPDGVDVEYLNEDSGENQVIECRLSGDSGNRPKRIPGLGMTTSTTAWRYGMRERRRIFYKPATYTFVTEMDGLNSEYGDAIAIASDVFGSQSGQVTAASGNTLTLDFVPIFDTTTSPNPTYFAALKDPQGDFSGLYTIVGGSPNNTITITDSPGIDFTPATDASPDSDGENTLIVIGTSDEWGKRAIIKRITPQGPDRVQIVAEEYVADIYSDDNNSPP